MFTVDLARILVAGRVGVKLVVVSSGV